MAFYGIDVSEWQGDINWSSVNADFAVLRAGYGRYAAQEDKKFKANYSGCKDYHIPCGVYWYSYALTAEDAVREANACLEVIKGRKYEYPIYYDVELSEHFSLGKDAVSDIISAFLRTVESAGYWVGLYMSAYYLKNYVRRDILDRYAVWVAHYDVTSPDYSGNYGMWQYTSTGSVSGISGNVDLDAGFVDYPALIKEAGLNGYSKSEQKYVELTFDGVEYSGWLSPME